MEIFSSQGNILKVLDLKPKQNEILFSTNEMKIKEHS
jgi:hypothetical protein